MNQPFEFLEELGKGAFGKVYLGKSKLNGDIRAVKVVNLEVSRDEEEELIREIKILAQCSHPNITRYYNSLIYDKSLWIIAEYVEVGSLRQLVRSTWFRSPFIWR